MNKIYGPIMVLCCMVQLVHAMDSGQSGGAGSKRTAHDMVTKQVVVGAVALAQMPASDRNLFHDTVIRILTGGGVTDAARAVEERDAAIHEKDRFARVAAESLLLYEAERQMRKNAERGQGALAQKVVELAVELSRVRQELSVAKRLCE